MKLIFNHLGQKSLLPNENRRVRSISLNDSRVDSNTGNPETPKKHSSRREAFRKHIEDQRIQVHISSSVLSFSN